MTEHSDIAPSAKSKDRFEFLPAALEVLETPPAPFGRIIAVTIALFFVLAVLWAFLGTIDVVAVSQGQTIPTGKVKIVQPLETGVVRAIHVEEGQVVAAGDLLIELDPTEAAANIGTFMVDLAQARLDAASGAALLADDPVSAFIDPADVNPDLIDVTRAWIAEEVAQHQAALSAVQSEILRSEAAIRSAEIEQTKLEQTIPLVDERLQAQQGLLAEGIVQRPTLLVLQQELYQQQAALATARQARLQNLASIETLTAREAEVIAGFRARASDQRRRALLQIATLEQELKKEEQRRLYRELRAPVSGTINQLAIHTIGAVVNTADRLLVIVPENTPLEIEALLLNKDIGFVDAGQVVEIKLEAFPFTRYGTLTGKLASVSNDAMIHERLGPVYKAVVTMDSQHITVDGRDIELSPGMNVSIEVKTGTRRIIEFFLSPLLRYKDEAIRER